MVRTFVHGVGVLEEVYDARKGRYGWGKEVSITSYGIDSRDSERYSSYTLRVMTEHWVIYSI